WSVAINGVEGAMVEVEADIGQGKPAIHLVGLPDTALNEAKERIRAAIRNSGHQWPNKYLTLGLSPGDLPKVGTGYDLALACSVLGAAGVVPTNRLATTVLFGELALDGRVRSVRGVLPGLLAALTRGRAIEVTAVHSIVGLLDPDAPLITTPPFVAPHHSISMAALIGGGSGTARPGAVSQAHGGVLFLDEACEVGSYRLDSMRTALEQAEMRPARQDRTVCYPARSHLITATNPCPFAPPHQQGC